MHSLDYIKLAVFPFEDLSLRNDLSIFSRAFGNELATELSRFNQSRVINFTNQLVSTNSPIPAFSDESNTDYYIQGSFRGEKDLVRINVQLYDGRSQFLIWGNRMEGQLSEVNEIQENLLTEVVSVLQHQINHDLLSKIKRKPKVEFRAYEHWLHGMDELKKVPWPMI